MPTIAEVAVGSLVKTLFVTSWVTGGLMVTNFLQEKKLHPMIINTPQYCFESVLFKNIIDLLCMINALKIDLKAAGKDF